MNRSIMALVALVLLASACARHGKKKFSALISGRITVADSLDDSGDYSNTEFIVLHRDTSRVDTLFRAATNRKGAFRGMVRFPKQGRYPVEVRRFQRIVSSYSLLLGSGDTIRVEGELPGFSQTAKTVSGEQATFETYQRLNKNYDRIMGLAARGALKPDTLPQLAQTWSNLYWELFEQRRSYYAAKLSAAESIRLLVGISDSLVVERIRQIEKEPMLGQVAAAIGAPALARTEGLSNALVFLDNLQNIHAADRDDRGSFIRLKVEMLADSGQVQQALTELRNYPDLVASWREFRFWKEAIEMDLTRLAPGMIAPDFTVAVGADSVKLSSLRGRPVLLEFAAFANPNYQNQYERMVATQFVYAKTGFIILSIPVDSNPALYEGFFQERQRNWPFTNPGEFQRANIGELYNVKAVPSRVLISRDGKIVRKYTGSNIELLYKDLQNQSLKEIAS